MTITCLLCDPRAVLDKDSALGTAHMASSLLEGCQPIATQLSQAPRHAGDNAPDSHTLLLNALRNVFKRAQMNTQLLDDISKYQFGGFNQLCLRCSAHFD